MTTLTSIKSIKKIVLVCGYPLSETVVRNRWLPIIRMLERGNVRVVVVAPGVERPSFDFDCLEYIGVESMPKTRGFLLRALREWRTARRLIKVAGGMQKDLMIVSIPSMFCLICMQREIKPTQTALDIRDLTWEYLPTDFFYWIMKQLLKLSVKAKIKYFDYISFTNESERTYLHSKFKLPMERLIFLPNGISRAVFKQLSFSPGFSSAQQQVRVSYIGNVGLAQNLRTLLAAAAVLRDIQFYIVGDGIDLHNIKRLCVFRELRNVLIVGKVDVTEVADWYVKTDILYAQLSASYVTAMPSKLYEYLATGKRIIYGGSGHPLSMLRDFENYVVIPPDDAEALTAELRRTLAKGDFRVHSERNRKLIKERFLRENNSRLYLQKLGVIV